MNLLGNTQAVYLSSTGVTVVGCNNNDDDGGSDNIDDDGKKEHY